MPEAEFAPAAATRRPRSPSDRTVTRTGINKVYVLMRSIYRALICVMCIKNQQNAPNAAGVFVL
jgi:hypothetical protein